MYRVSLINMPFVVLHIPSIALTQLKSIVQKELGDRVDVEIHYINHDFAHFLGLDTYRLIAGSHQSEVTGFGDWLFRHLAFPEQSNNTDEYLRRYFPEREKQSELKTLLFETWSKAGEFMDELIDKYELDQANLVGFTSMFSQNVACFAMARRIKERNPEVVTVMGGANCEWPMGREIALNVKQIDYVFSGPALRSFPEFIRCCLNDQVSACRKIRGVLCRDNAALAPLASVIGEELPIDVDIELDYDSYLDTVEKNFPPEKIKPTLLFETSRGCWWGEKSHCTFCGLNGLSMNYRALSPNKAVDLLSSLFKHSPRVGRLEAVDNIMPKNYPKDVFPRITTPQNMFMFYEVKADLTAEEMQMLAKVRVLGIQPGIEALATSTLKLMRKGTTAFQNLSFLKNCLLSGIYPLWNLLVGFPGEEEEIYKKYASDLPRLTHLPPPSGVYPVRFDRFSPYFVQAEKYGLDLRPLDYYSYIYPFDDQSLGNLAYYFDDVNVQAPYRIKTSKWIDQLRKRVDYWKARWETHSQQPQPQLYLKPESTIVHDSRSPKTIQHQVGPVGKRVLECLAAPKKLKDLASALSDVAGFDAEREVALLQYRGLVFQEGERFISLVLPEEPPEMTRFTH